MTYIQPAKHVFFDTDGSVLQNGSVYIGQPDQDPRTNQKTVTFTDAGGSSFTASQPLSVLNGRISYNGRPIVAEVDGEHSILVLNSNGTQIDYTPSVVPPAASGGATTDGIRYGLTLADVKALDVAVGDVVRSVGSVTATDDLGADWLVISSTGTPGDDVDTIDFDNGLQGRRDKSKLYNNTVLPFVADKTFNPDAPTEVWSGSATTVDVTDLSENGPGFYIVETSVGSQFHILSSVPLPSIQWEVYGTGRTQIDAGPSTFQITSISAYVDYTFSLKSFKVVEYSYEINNAGTVLTNRAQTSLTITAIYKV